MRFETLSDNVSLSLYLSSLSKLPAPVAPYFRPTPQALSELVKVYDVRSSLRFCYSSDYRRFFTDLPLSSLSHSLDSVPSASSIQIPKPILTFKSSSLTRSLPSDLVEARAHVSSLEVSRELQCSHLGTRALADAKLSSHVSTRFLKSKTIAQQKTLIETRKELVAARELKQ